MRRLLLCLLLTALAAPARAPQPAKVTTVACGLVPLILALLMPHSSRTSPHRKFTPSSAPIVISVLQFAVS